MLLLSLVLLLGICYGNEKSSSSGGIMPSAQLVDDFGSEDSPPSADQQEKKEEGTPVVFPEQRAPLTDTQAMKFLSQFGYILPGSFVQGTGSTRVNVEEKAAIITDSIKKYQKFYKLRQTGELDDDTKFMMSKPRCGVPDFGRQSLGGSGTKWNKKHLTYTIETYTNDLPQWTVKQSIKKAFDAWAEVTSLTFQELPQGQRGDIRIKFVRRDHGDNSPFDGRGGELGHAFFPTKGIVHFDDDEVWSNDRFHVSQENTKHDLVTIATHEIGHALGLDHIEAKNSIMFPQDLQFFGNDGYYNRPRLGQVDINAIQDLYGSRSSSAAAPPPPSVQHLSRQPAARTNQPYRRDDGIAWKQGYFNTKWAYQCSFNGHYITDVVTDAPTCIKLCYHHDLCRSYTWTSANGGTCFLATTFKQTEASSYRYRRSICGGWFQ